MNTMSPQETFVPDVPVIALDAAHLESQGIVGFNTKDMRARPYNLLRSQLMKKMAEGNHSLVGVTSAVPGAGKSFTVVNLALSLAKLEKFPVVLVDLDFRRGSLATYLGLQPQAGVAEALAGDATFGSLEMRVGNSHLTVLPALMGDESGSTLMSGPSFDDFLAHVRTLAGNGIAIFDLPPVFADDDAVIATQRFDGYLLLAEAGTTPAKHISDSIERLKPARCLGTILNRYHGGMFDSYRYGYGYGYGSYNAA
ncbi:MAG TPA: CpsD/CapB family tyrosine-protein kinase [Novosphingobium sp.]